MEFVNWFAITGYLAYAAAARSIQDGKFVILCSLCLFLQSAAIWACSAFAVKKLGYKAEDVEAKQWVYLRLINGFIISTLIVRQCQQRCGK